MSMFDDRCLDSNGQPETLQNVDYSKWFIRLLSWDGVVPLMMLSLPMLVRRFGPPNNDVFLVPAVVGALIFGILFRFSFGMRHIRLNHCSERMKLIQRVGLWTMIAVLVLVETVMCVIPPARLKQEDVFFLAFVGAIYLIVMACVLYPGRRVFDDADA